MKSILSIFNKKKNGQLSGEEIVQGIMQKFNSFYQKIKN